MHIHPTFLVLPGINRITDITIQIAPAFPRLVINLKNGVKTGFLINSCMNNKIPLSKSITIPCTSSFFHRILKVNYRRSTFLIVYAKRTLICYFILPFLKSFNNIIITEPECIISADSYHYPANSAGIVTEYSRYIPPYPYC